MQGFDVQLHDRPVLVKALVGDIPIYEREVFHRFKKCVFDLKLRGGKINAEYIIQHKRAQVFHKVIDNGMVSFLSLLHFRIAGDGFYNVLVVEDNIIAIDFLKELTI